MNIRPWKIPQYGPIRSLDVAATVAVFCMKVSAKSISDKILFIESSVYSKQNSTKIFGTKHDREMKGSSSPDCSDQLFRGPQFKRWAIQQLQAKTLNFNKDWKTGETLDDILPEPLLLPWSFKALLGMRHYDVQLIGGIVLHRGNIAEIKDRWR